MSVCSKHIGVLQWGDETPTTFTRIDLTARDLRAQLSSCAAIIAGGSPRDKVSAREPQEHFDLLVQTFQWMMEKEHRLPFFGFGYSARLLAFVAGADIQYRPQSREWGSVIIRRLSPAEGDPLLAGIPQEFHAHVFREDDIMTLPLLGIPLCNSDSTQYQMFKIAGKCIYGTQFQLFRDDATCAACKTPEGAIVPMLFHNFIQLL